MKLLFVAAVLVGVFTVSSAFSVKSSSLCTNPVKNIKICAPSKSWKFVGSPEKGLDRYIWIHKKKLKSGRANMVLQKEQGTSKLEWKEYLEYNREQLESKGLKVKATGKQKGKSAFWKISVSKKLGVDKKFKLYMRLAETGKNKERWVLTCSHPPGLKLSGECERFLKSATFAKGDSKKK